MVEDFFVVETTVKIVINNQFGAESAKKMIQERLNIPAVLEVKFEDTVEWLPGQYKK